ncbi:HGGxSTG domain-containing protein [Methylocystis sp. JAN1]|uniref:HGGxSTG domain-containing protein n=1 Tax=Methylocystis sp. JAN1 TaxID=3397211 RepID=UPI003FA2460F
MAKSKVQHRDKPKSTVECAQPAADQSLPAPDLAEADAIAEAIKSVGARKPRVRMHFNRPNGAMFDPPHDDDGGFAYRLLDAFGTESTEFMSQAISLLCATLRAKGERLPTEHKLNAAIAVIDGMRPRDEIEAMLGIQIVSTHEVAMEMLAKAKHAEHSAQLQEYGTLATKLMRTFAAQIEALSRMRRGGEQKVTVEHVHVHSGGQAVVGVVNPSEGGAQSKMEDNPMHLPMQRSPRCAARTRAGTLCQSPAMANGRCRMHGGCAGAPRGERNGNWRHGHFTCEAIAERRQSKTVLRTARSFLESLPLPPKTKG